eukprot:TRINITY_DN2185_c0_g1_i1.p2 TRINITY_DN2185_c0_g1~~TRINITY_DN2185_c0_g1_i1.p2  ORF type:complete len:215 (+),score=-43.55 TRINITY_DN2185_c0_g1_i1:946-1590(+)
MATPSLSSHVAVLIIADRMAAGDHPGREARSNAATPLTCGQDMDVPEIILNTTRRGSLARLDGPTAPDHAARIFTPGAVKSGFRISGVITLGPRELKAAITGAGFTPICVPRKSIVPTGAVDDRIYFLIASPASYPTLVAGNTCVSAVNSLPFSAALASIMPRPLASLTTSPLATRALVPRSQRTIFPATRLGSRVFFRHKLALRAPSRLAFPA